MMRVFKKVPLIVTAILMAVALLFVTATLVKHAQTASRIRDMKKDIQQEQMLWNERLKDGSLKAGETDYE